MHPTATPELYTLSLHAALPISRPYARRLTASSASARRDGGASYRSHCTARRRVRHRRFPAAAAPPQDWRRSEEHTSELQSLRHLVCRLLLEKKNHNGPEAHTAQ